ncbi:YdcF family protein [Polymorphobacter sp.]|uniref:YdcF family protein n=1 Tax=Polymorphobacter sp. TaxID=1909290 RepID=UPI003F705E89
MRNPFRRGPAVVRGSSRGRSGQKRGRIGLAGVLVRLLAAVALAWGGGLVWFGLTLPAPAPLAATTDSVVVLTGGRGRLARGLAVLEAGSARRMLISGVAPTTTRAQLAEAAQVPVSRLSTTDLGYGAVDTRSNAEETAGWIKRGNHRSLRLVTSAGHMRRARLELARVLPAGIEVVPDAVPHETGAPGIPWEYTKFLWRRLAILAGAE